MVAAHFKLESTMTPKKLALKAGLLYLLLVPLGIMGIIYVPEFLVVANDGAATVNNLVNNEFTFRLSILAALAIQVVQLLVAVALYDLLKPVNQRFAAYIVMYSMCAMPIAMINELFHVAILYLINSQTPLEFLQPNQINDLIMWLLNLHADGIMIAHVFWGFWLMPMGYLIAKSKFIPSIVGWIILLGGVSYILDTIFWLILPNSNINLAGYFGWGELVLALWLVVKGVHSERWLALAK